jgi:acyl carrier protein
VFRRKSASTKLDGPLTEASLRDWLVRHLATRVDCDPSEVDETKTFEEYGLDSRVAVQVSGALEKVVERRLSPALLYEHQNIRDLSAFLTSELDLPRDEQRAPAPPIPTAGS